MDPQEFLRLLKTKVDSLSEPFTWGHIARLCLALAAKHSSFRDEPLLKVLVPEIERRVLAKVSGGGGGLTPEQIAEIGVRLREYEGNLPAPELMPDRFLRWIASGEAFPADWTLPLVRNIFAENRLVPGHFDGTQSWPAGNIPSTGGEAKPEKGWQQELDSLVGLEAVKSEVRRLYKFLTVERWHRQEGNPTKGVALHQVFLGNPGTGKTSVARILARIYREFGFLSKGHLVETDRSGLVGAVIGATEAKTEEVIRTALGGVLFIDEAYSLATESQQDFGQRAIDTLVKTMEDRRGDLVVIVAGYRNEMERFLGANPGLASRFNRYLDFPDYSDEELAEIFRRFSAERQFSLAAQIPNSVMGVLKARRLRMKERFGNARDARTLWEMCLMRQAERIYDACKATGLSDETLARLSKDERGRIPMQRLTLLTEADVPQQF
jgi:hypothetical protein